MTGLATGRMDDQPVTPRRAAPPRGHDAYPFLEWASRPPHSHIPIAVRGENEPRYTLRSGRCGAGRNGVARMAAAQPAWKKWRVSMQMCFSVSLHATEQKLHYFGDVG